MGPRRARAGAGGVPSVNPDSGESPARTSTRISLALECACVGVWVAAVASSGLVGVWIANGGAAIALGTLSIMEHRDGKSPNSR